ncbi:hypothetical protein OWR29_08870 [Actinoplanes sp. Pm04-4]|uniref:Nucleoside phosphorylase domain-containing protein n=1 Tax=Paractinoplanes pyxinae TaxID=2997416 RepID=A0ABT4AV82_9ACTN|nr:hypothetical protein [Actinoplanes pyxinae]MCY1138107.1 hypothetical protein [Actinoplanes pyxinae]
MNPLQMGDLPALDADYAEPLAPPAPRPVAPLGTVLAPMRVEAAALRRGLAGDERLRVWCAGAGLRRARRTAMEPDVLDSPALAVAGLGRALSPSLRPGDVVVASVVRADALTEGVVPPARWLPTASLLAAALRSRGLTVHTGVAISTDRLSGPAERARLAMTGALVADLESAWLLARCGNRPAACVRVVARDARRHPAGLGGLRRALLNLSVVAAGLQEWAAAAPGALREGRGKVA